MGEKFSKLTWALPSPCARVESRLRTGLLKFQNFVKDLLLTITIIRSPQMLRKREKLFSIHSLLSFITMGWNLVESSFIFHRQQPRKFDESIRVFKAI